MTAICEPAVQGRLHDIVKHFGDARAYIRHLQFTHARSVDQPAASLDPSAKAQQPGLAVQDARRLCDAEHLGQCVVHAVHIDHAGLGNALADRCRHAQVEDEDRDQVEEGREQHRLAGAQHTGGDDRGDGVGGVVEAVGVVEQQYDDDRDDGEKDDGFNHRADSWPAPRRWKKWLLTTIQRTWRCWWLRNWNVRCRISICWNRRRWWNSDSWWKWRSSLGRWSTRYCWNFRKRW